MAERLTRKALYDLVWSEPMMTLSARFRISDVALTGVDAGVVLPELRITAEPSVQARPRLRRLLDEIVQHYTFSISLAGTILDPALPVPA